MNCPDCNSELIVFCGLCPDGKGCYKNKWECCDCGKKWEEEITKKEINDTR